MSVSQPDYDPIIQELFHAWFNKSCVMGTHGPASKPNAPFMPSKRLGNYFKDTRRLKKILGALFETSYPPVTPEAIQGKYDKVLGILLCIGKGRFIQTFVQYPALRDEKLPFDSCPTHFPTDGGDEHFFESFYKQQWTFCLPTFRRGETNLRYDSDVILPIVFKEELSGGASATVYKIMLHESYNNLRDTGDLEQNQSDRFANTFVLKTYKTKDAEQYYKNEVDGFEMLRSGGGLDPNMIAFYGSYIQDDSYNVLLDFADEGTLEQHFQKTEQPSAEDILPFWRELFNVIKPLMRMHEISPGGSTESPAEMQIFQGWHQDIKPSNIFIKSDPQSPYKRRFVLADLGLSHFRRKILQQEDVADEDTRGTRTYGAPECYRSDDFVQRSVLKVKQKVDIWSLACVFSEAATWVLRGHSGIERYRDLRMGETEKIDGFRDHDCFHNGEKVLDAVDEWHQSISDDIRRGDYITAMVLELIREMFWDFNSRPDAMQLWKKSQEIIKKAERRSLERPSWEPHAPGGHQYSSNRRLSDTSQSPPRTPPMLPPDSRISPPPRWQPERTPFHSGGRGLGGVGGSLRVEGRPSSADRITGRGCPSARTIRQKRHTQHAPNSSLAFPASAASTDPGDFSRLRDRELMRQGLAIESGLPDTPPRKRPPRDLTQTHHNRGYGNDWISTSATDHDPPSESQYSDGPVDQTLDPIPLRPGFDDFNPTPPMTSTSASHHPFLSPQDPPSTQRGPPTPDSPKGQLPLATVDPNWRSPPFLTVHAAQQYVAAMKATSPGKLLSWTGISKKKAVPISDEYLLDRLNNRDHVFLIDDGQSMGKHWSDVIFLFGTLAYMVKLRDPDGIELRFTNSLLEGRSKDRKSLLELLENEVNPRGDTDISVRLGQVLDNYITRLRSKSTRPVRPMSIYIFTDGVWQPQCEFAKPIERLVATLEELNSPEKQVGIQFIRFGEDPVGKERLEYLDKGLESRDIVDTEPFPHGNVWKMFLGPLNPWFDGDNNPSQN